MTGQKDNQEQDDLFIEHLKDQFVLFYALTVTAIETYKYAREHYQKQAAKTDKKV